MKYIHSMWSTPATKGDFDNKYDKKYLTKNFYSYLFSALLVKKHGHTIELFCDKNAYEIYSQIPYDKIHVIDFDNDGVDSKFWIYGKIKAHSLMNEPYIHIDGDVFLFNDIVGKKMENGEYDLVIQSIENDEVLDYHFNVYRNSYKPFLNINKDFIRWNKYHLTAFNCGVAGFHDIDFKNKYVDLVKNTLISLSKGENFKEYRNKYAGMFLIAEQSLLYYLTMEYGKKYIEILPYDKIMKKKYENWMSIGDDIGYCHMLGYSKYKPKVIMAIKNNINKKFPKHKNIITDFENKYLY